MVAQLSSLLDHPAGYRLFRWLISGNALQTYLAEYVKPVPGQKILDLGCGTADILDHLPAVHYTGLDLNPHYIRSARKRFGSKGRFLCGDVATATIEAEPGAYDLVLATGLLHHLDNTQAARLFALARRSLRPTGHLITFDGCRVPGQSRLIRWLFAHDRGRFIRTREDSLRLASLHFRKVEPHLRRDLLRIPYTHLILRCSL